MASGINQEFMAQLLEVFSIELDEQIQVVTDGLLVLEKGVTGKDRQHVLDSVFRAAHNIKGSARGVEVTDVSEIAHQLENIFAVLKRENSNPDGAVTDIALESLDRMRQAMADHRAQQPLGFDKAALLSRLEAISTAVAIQGKSDSMADAPAPVQKPALPMPQAAPETPESKLEPHPAATLSQPVETVKPADSDKPLEAESAIEPQAGPADVIRVNLGKLENLAAMMEELQVTKIEMDDHLANVQQLRNLVQDLTSSWRRNSATRSGRQARQDYEDWLRRSADAIAELDVASVRAHREMSSSTNRLGILVESLQGSVRMMRLVPVATLLRPMSRLVRDITRELEKKVHFEISGDEIEIDRVVLDGIRDPVVHLLRNALDHGIESPQQRMAKGKTAEGRLHVSVKSEGSQIVMTVQDDGDGISADKIAASARKKKIVSETELAAMGHDDILGLIFRPGFTSKEIITNISGRGVGLDVVVANLRKLKGSVQVETDVGKGTRFILRLPITLATDHGVLVRAGGAVFAIPTSAVDRIMDIKPEQILEVEASHAILHHGRTTPLRDLATTLDLETRERIDKKTLPVVVVAKGWDNVAFLVDEIIGEREIVVKPFRPPLLAVRNITGGTLTGSGEVIMVLNPSDLVDSAMQGSLAHLRATDIGAAEEKASHVLVVDDSITTRTLEKSILEHAGYKVSVAVDGKQAWDILQQDHDFSLIISDVEMPVMNGFQLTELIKQSERLKHLPVIIVTSLAKEADRRRGIEVGADAYIVKGQFETKILLDVVEQLI
jgi:chemotaxis protein histidine kinase CheA